MSTQIDYVDAQEIHRRHPRKFAVPSAAELAAVAPGDAVKVCAGGERFWVAVRFVDGGRIVGTVDNDLVCAEGHGLGYGDEVCVRAENVYDITPAAVAA